jgi:hypothetical protein
VGTCSNNFAAYYCLVYDCSGWWLVASGKANKSFVLGYPLKRTQTNPISPLDWGYPSNTNPNRGLPDLLREAFPRPPESPRVTVWRRVVAKDRELDIVGTSFTTGGLA